MERFLLFDSGCGRCSNIARQIELEANGWLLAQSLHEPAIQAILDRARPDWRWEPTLLEVSGEQVNVYTGAIMRLKLLKGLGFKPAGHITRMLRQPVGLPSNPGRREFLQQGSMVLGGLALLGLPGFQSVSYISVKPSNWKQYEDKDYGFALEYPEDWQMETLIHQPTPFIDSEAIIKRLLFSSPYGMVYLDTWLANGQDFANWLKWYAETRLDDKVPAEPNSTVAGFPALSYIETGQPDWLNTFYGDGNYVYRLMNRFTNVFEALQSYWHMLDTFTVPGGTQAVSLISTTIKQEADRLVGKNGPLVNTCCNFTSNGNPFICCTQGNCVWWAYRQMGSVPFTGNAGTWWGQVPNFYNWTRKTGFPPFNKRNIAWQSATTAPPFGHVAYIATYTGGTNVNISDMGCDIGQDCVRNIARPAANYGGFIYRVNEPI